MLTGGKGPEGTTTYTSTDGRFTYSWSGGALTINGSITVEGFSNRDLGIYLEQEDEPEDPNKPNPNKPVYDPGAARRRVDPLTLDLNGDGLINTVALDRSTTYFDIDADGFAERTGWIAPTDGILVYDGNGNGFVDNGTEVFGSQGNGGFVELGAVENKNRNRHSQLTAAMNVAA